MLGGGHNAAVMPVYVVVEGLLNGLGSVPYGWTLLKALPWIGLLYILKTFFSGASTTSERNMHGKVVMVTVRASRTLDMLKAG